MNVDLSFLIMHVLESTLWCLFLLVLLLFVRIDDSGLKCWIHRLCLLKFVVPTIFFSSLLDIPAESEFLPVFVVFAEPISTLSEVTTYEERGPILHLWMLGISSLFIFGLLVVSRFHHKVQRDSKSFNQRESEILQEVLEHSDLHDAQIQGCIVESGPSIALYGIFRPRIIAKRSFLGTLDDEELATAFQHEITHWIRKDHLWRLFAELLFCLFWFHPFIWFTRTQLLLATEKACDEQVLATGRIAHSYANCLLKAAEFSNQQFQFGSISLSESSLKQRVSNVINYQKVNHNIMKLFAVILTSITLFGGSFFLFAETSAANRGNIYNYEDLDLKPKALKMIPPVYPKALKEAKVDGRVELIFVIDVDGNVVDADIERSTHEAFEQPSLDAINQWKFSRAELNGEAVYARLRAPLVFKAESDINSMLKELKDSSDLKDRQFAEKISKKLEKWNQLKKAGKMEKAEAALKETTALLKKYYANR